jgi:predicted dienelactone hydrolase
MVPGVYPLKSVGLDQPVPSPFRVAPRRRRPAAAAAAVLAAVGPDGAEFDPAAVGVVELPRCRVCGSVAAEHRACAGHSTIRAEYSMSDVTSDVIDVRQIKYRRSSKRWIFGVGC